MSEWISVKDKLPDEYDVVWIFWRDREVLLACRTCEGREHLECEPTEGWWSFEDDKCRWTNWWMPVTRESLDTPDHPVIVIN